jgi:hypothetical protein
MNRRHALRLLALIAAPHAYTPAASNSDNHLQQIAFDSNDTTYFSSDDAQNYKVDRFAGTLQYLREPSFRGALVPAGSSALRFIWRRSFHPHIVVRILIHPTQCMITTTSLGPSEVEWSREDSRGVSTPVSIRGGAIVRHDSISAPVSSCTDLANAFKAAVQWNANAAPDIISVDGSDWVFETLNISGHHAFSRFSPDSAHSPTVWRAGVNALRLANALPPKRELY